MSGRLISGRVLKLVTSPDLCFTVGVHIAVSEYVFVLICKDILQQQREPTDHLLDSAYRMSRNTILTYSAVLEGELNLRS